MLKPGIFKRPKNTLESYGKQHMTSEPVIPEEIMTVCPSCKAMLVSSELSDNLHICPKCDYHFRMNARQRIGLVCDNGSFDEHDKGITSSNLIGFPGYNKKLKSATMQSGESEAVVTGTAMIGGHKCAVFVMEPYFMMGSMGTVVGEKITRLFEYATQHKLPVIGFTVSGGARMQEGILSLMQMAKTSGAVKLHSDAGLLYVTVITDPTTGGVTASFGMEGDIIIAEPGALIGFAGPRVIEQTIRQKLPQGFQSAQFVLDKGFLDAVVNRKVLKKYLARVLLFHKGGDAQ